MSNNGQLPSQRNRPIQTVRDGNSTVAVWRNVADDGKPALPMYNVTVSRSYRDGDNWKDSSSFGYDDLLVLAKALNECHTLIHALMDQDVISRRHNQGQLNTQFDDSSAMQKPLSSRKTRSVATGRDNQARASEANENNQRQAIRHGSSEGPKHP